MSLCQYLQQPLVINKNFIRELGSQYIKVRKQVCSQLSSYETTDYPLYKKHWLLFVSVHENMIPAGQLHTCMHAYFCCAITYLECLYQVYYVIFIYVSIKINSITSCKVSCLHNQHNAHAVAYAHSQQLGCRQPSLMQADKMLTFLKLYTR